MASEFCKNNPDDPLCTKSGLMDYSRPTSKNQQTINRISNVPPNPIRRKGSYKIPNSDMTPRRHDSKYHAKEPPPPTTLKLGVDPPKRKRKVVGLKGSATRPIKASHTELTPEEIMKAKMLQAGKIAELESKTTNLEMFIDEDTFQNRVKYGLDQAQRYLDKEGINYTVEPELSNLEGLILINNETGIPKAVFRGTNFKNVKDLQTDLAIVHGTEDLTAQFRSAKDQVIATNEIYEPVEETIGFSLGGAKAITVGQELGIKSTTFNPAVSPSHLKNVPLNSSDNHLIIRTTENPTDILAGLKPSAFKIKSILPLNEPKWLDPKSAAAVHNLTNFTETGNRRSNNLEVLQDEMIKQGKIHNEMVGLHEAKMAVNSGKTLTEFLKEFSPNEVQSDGSLGVRVQEDSKIFKFWEKAGGDISIPEADKIIENSERAFAEDPNRPADDFLLKDYEIDEFLEKPSGIRDNRVQSKAEEVFKVGTEFNEAGEIHIATRDAMKASLSPANIGVGLVGGIAGAKVSDLIDPNRKLGAVGHESLSGGLGGAFTVGAIATLGGEALTASVLAPAIAGGAVGAIAGYETNKAVANSLQKAGANRDTVESLADISGGAVGGAATSLAGIGASALLGAELGELGGVAGVALGAGVGALFGLGAYAVGAAKYNTPKAKAKRNEQDRLQQIANEAGYGTYEEFQQKYDTPEDYYREVREEMFGYDPMKAVPLTKEQVEQNVIQQAELQDQRDQIQQNSPYVAAQMRRRQGTVGTVAPDYQAQRDRINEVSKVTQEIQN